MAMLSPFRRSPAPPASRHSEKGRQEPSDWIRNDKRVSIRGFQRQVLLDASTARFGLESILPQQGELPVLSLLWHCVPGGLTMAAQNPSGALWVCLDRPSSSLAQGNDGVDAHGAARGDIAGRKRH
jgi:hypothetical protein